ncbi:MAG: ABC transporter ATP-binding protein [Chitinophagales bacterium]|nr:ABC transporter ATP-binding protein [Chitinophagales bacterium]
MALAIRVENLSKQYRLGQIGTGTISHDLNRFWAQLRGKEDPYSQIGVANDRSQKATSDYVWALKDINFEIEQGDAVGIIGRNGAGKSTLLKILSRTTLPTTGSVKMKGRIASLLEVGTGFHPEMTGRENIYQNGAILGMTRHEITRKFDEIVDFSGCEAYIDTPVKRYSSGMYVRLAFAVAAHLESEILIVDEVLAVGDAEFQKKCLGKMNDVAKGEGRTVLFVSHNMGAVSQLCKHSILMVNGKTQEIDKTKKVLDKYTEQQIINSIYESKVINKLNFLRKIHFISTNDTICNSFNHDEEIQIKFDIQIDFWKNDLLLVYGIQNNLNTRVCLDFISIDTKARNVIYSVKLPKEFLTPGVYSIDVSLLSSTEGAFDIIFGACTFEVINNKSRLTPFLGMDYGNVFLNSKYFHINK